MKLKEIALIAEILTAIAVVISLIFVGIQVKHSAEETARNTRVVETNAYQNLVEQYNTITLASATNPQLAELLARGEPDSPQERRQLDSLFLSYFRHGELAFLQFENGLIEEESAVIMTRPVRSLIANNEVANGLWHNYGSLNPRYVAFMNALILADSGLD